MTHARKRKVKAIYFFLFIDESFPFTRAPMSHIAFRERAISAIASLYLYRSLDVKQR